MTVPSCPCAPETLLNAQARLQQCPPSLIFTEVMLHWLAGTQYPNAWTWQSRVQKSSSAPALVQGRGRAFARVCKLLAVLLVEGHGAIDAPKVRGCAGPPE